MPVSLIGTFAAFNVLDFTINTLTLFAIVLAIGLVVDDAIVVIENVEQHMETDNLSPKEATIVAMKEVQGPVVAIACVLASIFIPVAFLSGMTGVLYKQFALTIAVAMAISAFVALSLTPALSAMLLKNHKGEVRSDKMAGFFRRFNTAFEGMKKCYNTGVSWLIGHVKMAVVILLAFCFGTVWLYQVLPTTFVPDEDQGMFLATVQLPEGTSLNRTEDTMDWYASDIEQIPGIAAVMQIAGYDMSASSTKSNAGTMVIKLDPWDDRTSSDLQASSLINKVTMLGATKYTEASSYAFNTSSIPGLGMVGGWTMQLQDNSGHTNEELNTITKQIVAAANQRPELTGVRSTFSINSPTYEFDVDREKVKNMGVTLSDVFTALQVNYGGMQVNDFNEFGRTYKVVLQSDMMYRDAVDSARFIFVKNSNGGMVPLSTLIKPKLATEPSVLSRFNGVRTVQIQGNAASGYSSGQAMTAMEDIVKTTAPSGFSVEWSGQSREEKNAGTSTLEIMALAMVFAFLCLAALYESWSVPYAVLLTVPTGIFGAFFSEYIVNHLGTILGFAHEGMQNSIYMQIGVIMLIGLAAKNAILIVEFAKVRVDKGMAPIQAAKEAAALRLRPIIMTSLSFIIGCMPLAVASGAGAAARNSMGVAVVGGMLFATCFGVFLIPVFFVIVETISAKWRSGT
ncbi:MAG: efflux RND transporter permease subunit [Megasphaera sp.]|nr:efflux RND transporter permease subunit [Megasphaera sp.]